MSPEEVLRHLTRRRIYEHIVRNPGVTFNMLRSVFDINDGTLNYHLDYLRKSDLIDIRKTRNNRCYVPKDRSREAEGLDRMSRRVLSIIRDAPGIDREGIKAQMDLEGSDLTRTLSALKRRRLIRIEKRGRNAYNHPVSDQEIVDRMLLVLLERYVEGEISYKRYSELKERLEGMADR